MTEQLVTFRALSHLLLYPDDAMRTVLGEVADVLREERGLSEPTRRALLAFTEDLKTGDALVVQERYVSLFDRTRSLSLHLFEHIHGESRDRGQAMSDLLDLYRRHGLEISANELPDYLPLFLEFLAQLPKADALKLLDEPMHIVSALGARLRNRDSAYGLAFSALEELAGVRPLIVSEPDEEVDIDAEWEDAEIRFLDAGAPSCQSNRPQ